MSTLTTPEKFIVEEKGDRLFLITDERNENQTIWKIQEREKPEPLYGSSTATVVLTHPRIQANYSSENPLNAGAVTVKTGEYYSSRETALRVEVADVLLIALGRAVDKQKRLYKQLEPQVADRIAERKEREEKREVYIKQRREINDSIQEIKTQYIKEFTEAVKWYEGQSGRIKRSGVAKVNRFSAMGHIRGEKLYWRGLSGNLTDDYLKNIKWIEIRYQGERDTERIELPKYPQKELDELNQKLSELQPVY